MGGDLTIRKVRTGSGSIAVQVVRYIKRKCIVVRHIGSAKTDDEVTVLLQEAEIIKVQMSAQLSLFSMIEDQPS